METNFNADLYNYGNLETGYFPGLETPDKIYELAKAIHPHPTLSEVVMEAAHGAIDRAIHI